jgi:uncharacterized MAPEG superfamily protein
MVYTLSGGFIWVVLMITPMIIAAPVLNVLFIKSSISSALLAALPTTVEKIPYLMLLAMVLLAFAANLPVIFYIASVAKDGYDNNTPRKTQADFLNKHPLMLRLKSAHLNTQENLPLLAVSIFVATSLNLDKLIIAKMTLFYMLNRAVFVVAYALNIDVIRCAYSCLCQYYIIVCSLLCPLLGPLSTLTPSLA